VSETGLLENTPRPADAKAGGWFGIIARDVTNLDERAWFILPEFDIDIQWGPARWQARDTVSLPVRGNACLVVFDNRHNPWVVCWWPFDS
jgi:hypothetical protein